MKKIIFLFGLAGFILLSCSSQSSGTGGGGVIGAAKFQAVIDSLPNEQLIDVRTAGEFGGGHIKGATNIDWNGNDFGTMAGMLDKSKPVMVYCHSGRRSAEAADWLRSNGFTTVYELQNGITGWMTSAMPLEQGFVSAAQPTSEVSTAVFAKKVNEGKVLLVDFGATWCGPCKILAPRLDELEKEMSGQFELLKLDADRDAALADSMNITALPTLFLYKGGKLLWRNEGLVPKDLVKGKLDDAIKN